MVAGKALHQHAGKLRLPVEEDALVGDKHVVEHGEGACSSEGHPTQSGNYMIDLLLANVCKQNVTRFPYEIVRLAEDIAGGLMVTAGPGESRRRAWTPCGSPRPPRPGTYSPGTA